MKKVIIVGANACGVAVASRLRRLNENVEILLLDKGNYMSFANCGLPYYIGGEVKDIHSIDGSDSEEFAKQKNMDVYLNSEVIGINIIDKSISIHDTKSDRTYEESYDDLVLATGAELDAPANINLSAKNVFSILTIDDAIAISEYIDQHPISSAMVIGGGYIGLEMIEQLYRRNLDLSLVTDSKQVLNLLDIEMANIVHKKLFEKNVQLFFDSEEMPFKSDLVVIATGVKPNNHLAKMADLELGEYSGVLVDDYLRTSNENIWAGGDLIEIKNFITNKSRFMPLGGIASRHGRIIADNIISGQTTKYQPGLGTSVLKIFELTVAMTGINEKVATKLGIEHEAVYIQAKSHASYYPGSKPLTMKLVFSKPDYKILGAQIIGEDGADKRIDVISTAIQAGMRADHLDELELAYAPPYSSVKDPVNLLGMFVSDIRDGLVKQIQWHELDKLDTSEILLIDVRPSSVVKTSTIRGAVQIPIEKLRDAMPISKKDRDIVLFCGDGAFAYQAYRMLSLHGFNKLQTLAGGLGAYADAHYMDKKNGQDNLLGDNFNMVLA